MVRSQGQSSTGAKGWLLVEALSGWVGVPPTSEKEPRIRDERCSAGETIAPQDKTAGCREEPVGGGRKWQG